MKLLFNFIPIAILTFNILTVIFPTAEFYLSTDIGSIDIKFSITYFFIYTVLSFLMVLFEESVLPIILINKIKPFKNITELEKKNDIKMKELFNVNIYKTWTKNNPAIEFYHLLTYVSTSLVLWFLCLNSILVIIPITLIVISTYFTAKIINTLLVKSQNNHEHS